MGRRYSRIKQAASLEAALTHYTTYLATPRVAKTGAGKQQEAKVAVYVNPFNVHTSSTEVVKATGHKTPVNTYVPDIGTYASLTLPSGSTAIALAHFKAARLVLVTPDTAAGTYTASKVTGTSYLKKNNKSVSIPFGNSITGTAITEGAAFSAISGLTALANFRKYLKAEVFRAV